MPKTRLEAAFPGGANTYAPQLEKSKHALEVPIFDEHDGNDEGLPINFTADILEKIAMACNQRYKLTGDAAPITDGHTSDDPNHKPPDILGYAKHFKVKPFRGKKAIFATLEFDEDKWDRAKKLQRRSIELWQDMCIDPVVLQEGKRRPIDSIALLGAERPARDLGLMKENCKGMTKYKYSLNLSEGNMGDQAELVRQCVEAIQSLPEFAYLKELMGKQQMEYGADPEEEMALAEDDLAVAEQDVAEDEAELEPAKLRMQRDQERRRYAKLDTEHRALAARLGEMERKSRVADRRADLLGLEQEGISFDLAEEIETVSDMEPARYSKHVQNMRKRYQRAPVGIKLNPIEMPGQPASKEAQKQQTYEKLSKFYERGNAV